MIKTPRKRAEGPANELIIRKMNSGKTTYPGCILNN